MAVRNIRRFRRGEVLSAERMNELLDVVLGMRLSVDHTLRMIETPLGTNLSVVDQSQRVPFKNNSGSDCPAFGGMWLNTPTTLDTSGHPYFLVAEKPDTTFYRNWIVNGDEVVAAGDIGFGFVANGSRNRLCVAAYDGSGTPTVGSEWGLKPSQFTLSKNYPACFTCYGVLDSTNQWMLGIPHPIDRIVGKAKAAIAPDATNGIVKLCYLNSGVETVITSLELSSVVNRCEGILTDDICFVEWFNSTPYITNYKHKARWIRVSLPGTLLTTDGSIASCTVQDFWQGYDPGGSVTVYNLPISADYMFSGTTGHVGLAVLDDIDDKYRFVQMECPS